MMALVQTVVPYDSSSMAIFSVRSFSPLITTLTEINSRYGETFSGKDERDLFFFVSNRATIHHIIQRID